MGFAVIAIACLFCKFTMLIGIGLLILLTTNLFRGKIATYGSKSHFSDSRILGSPITFGIGNSGLRIRAENFDARVGWEMVHSWSLCDSWLTITTQHAPRLYFPIDNLREEGVLASVIDLCHEYGTLRDLREVIEHYELLVDSLDSDQLKTDGQPKE